MSLDPNIWRRLPVELIRWIIEHSEPSIDVQLCFKIRPKRLDEAKCWKLWWLLKSHDGIMYNFESKSLHIFRIRGCHIVRRPIEMSWHTAGLTVFNDAEEDHFVEFTCPCGEYCVVPKSDSWVTEMRILIKGVRPVEREAS